MAAPAEAPWKVTSNPTSSSPTVRVSVSVSLETFILSPAFNQRTLSPNVIFTSIGIRAAVEVVILHLPFESVVVALSAVVVALSALT